MDDSDRYREMLQRSLLTEGWEIAFDASRFREWVRNNEGPLRARAAAVLGKNVSSFVAQLAEIFEEFVPTSPYDLPTTESTFRPLLETGSRQAFCSRCKRHKSMPTRGKGTVRLHRSGETRAQHT
jgi:DNA-binding SARP family transcriptional activator